MESQFLTLSNNSELFIRLCGELVFGKNISIWNQLTAEQREQFCELARRNGWSRLFLRMLGRNLPDSYFNRFMISYQKKTLRQLIEADELKKLYALLELEKISFIPVKGVDLAFRIYPEHTLRAHGDWDILFHKEDCPKVLALLKQHNWQSCSGCEQEKNPALHHYERIHNQSQFLEVHWTLPGFGNVVPEEIWKETITLNKYHHVLTPEMNMLLISAHASVEGYTHVPEWKILMDAGYILQHDAIDWQKIHQLADHWGILRPDILLNTWNEYFPEGLLPAESLNMEHKQLFLRLFSARKKIAGTSAQEKAMNMPEQHNLNWLMNKLKGCFCRKTICLKYHIHPDSCMSLLLFGCYDIIKKSLCFFKHICHKNKSLQHYYQDVKEVEKLIPPQQMKMANNTTAR